MKPEIEAKFLNADHDALRQKLTEAGGRCVEPMRLTRRRNFDFPDGRLDKAHNGWVRLRDSGDKLTLAYKQLDHRGLDGTREVSLDVQDMDSAAAFLEAIGLVQVTYQETKRESWALDDCEIELDEWPWIKPFIEIEGRDETSLKAVAAKLGLDWNRARHGSVEIVYADEYDVTDQEINRIPVITFEEPLPDWLEERRRL